MVTIELVNGQTINARSDDAQDLAMSLWNRQSGFATITDTLGQTSYVNPTHVVRVTGGQRPDASSMEAER